MSRVVVTALDAHLLRRAAGLVCVAAGVYSVAGFGWAAIVTGLLVMEPWRRP